MFAGSFVLGVNIIRDGKPSSTEPGVAALFGDEHMQD
jgi:hypothetical protein